MSETDVRSDATRAGSGGDRLETTHHEADNYGHYQLLADATRIGEMTYLRTAQDRILVNHTFVDPSRRGQGLARRLVDRVVADMRETEGKISPSCVYLRRVFENDPEEFADVWDR